MEREAQKARFLAANGLADAARVKLAGDASTRVYERLTAPGGASLILMDQPPQAETAPCPPGATEAERIAAGYNAMSRLAAGRIEAFVAVAGWLREQGLSAPRIVAHDAPAGLAVIEDLGDDLFATKIADGADERPLYEAAVDVLARLHAAPPPERLEASGEVWPLLAYDRLALATGTDTFLEWWPQFAGLPPVAEDAADEWRALWTPAFERGAAQAHAFAHRDYHAQNLLWLPDRQGIARVGLLDFQDAVRAHPAWDLTHLLQDARRDVSPELEAAMLDRYLAARPDLDRDAFLVDYRALAASNAARILGRVFARQALLGRAQYREFMPRTWRYLERNLTDPALAPLRAWFDRHVPAGARA